MNTRFLILLLALSLTGCNPPDDSAATVADAAATSTDDAQPATVEGFSGVDNTPTPQPAAFTGTLNPGQIPAQVTDGAEPRLQTGTDDKNNDDSVNDKAAADHLYSAHDKYHQVTCWYMYGNGSWAISCLPDKDVTNVKP